MILLKEPSQAMTATQMCHYFNRLSRPEGQVKLTSLSSLLKKMYDAGELFRIESFGPRGGYGYHGKMGD